MKLSQVKAITLPEGKVVKITADNMTLWQAPPTFTNQIPISTDLDGSIFNVVGYKANTYIGSSTGVIGDMSGYDTTGFFPIGYGANGDAVGEVMLYLKNIKAIPTLEFFRVAIYGAKKDFFGLHTGKHMVTAAQSVKIIYTLGEDGYINSLDLSALTGYYHYNLKKDPAFCRICAPSINGNSIITVNEPIE